jgi:hypothetical protein
MLLFYFNDLCLPAGFALNREQLRQQPRKIPRNNMIKEQIELYTKTAKGWNDEIRFEIYAQIAR